MNRLSKLFMCCFIVFSMSGCGKAYEDANVETTTTTKKFVTDYTEKNSTSVSSSTSTTTTTTTTTTKKSAYKSVGNSKLYYGKYEGELEGMPWDATITIKEDGTATYVGYMYINSVQKKVNLTGKWTVKSKAIMMSDFDKNKYDGVFFKWSNGEEEAYALGNKYFGDQFHGFNFKKG